MRAEPMVSRRIPIGTGRPLESITRSTRLHTYLLMSGPGGRPRTPKLTLNDCFHQNSCKVDSGKSEDQLSFHRKEFYLRHCTLFLESTSQRSFAFGLSSVFPQGLKEAMLRTHFEPAPWIDRQLMSPFPLRGDVSQRCGIAFSRSYQKTTC